MPILNYTTSITVEKTTAEIQRKLALAGAQAVMCEYNDDGLLSAMSFRIITASGPISFRLPANYDGVLVALENSRKVPARLCNYEQAARVSWRIIKDWIEAQLAIVEAELAQLEEVFLPYAQNESGKTLYETIKENKWNPLLEG